MARRTRERAAVVADEFSDVSLGDARRNRRAQSIAGRLALQPQAGLPGAMADRAMLEALYRHLSNEDVSFEALHEPHARKCAARIVEAGEAYAVHDTTTCSFPGKVPRDGLGTLHEKNQGFLAHVTLAVSTDGARIPLGVLATELIVRREIKHTRRRTTAERMRDPERESERWVRGIRRATERATRPGQLIHVADREADIYELLNELVTNGHRFIIRASQDRLVEVDPEGIQSLVDTARETPTAFTIEVPVSSRQQSALRRSNQGRKARAACLSFAARSLMLCRPDRYLGHLPKRVAVNVVHVFELGPPVGEPPIEWLLLTSEPVTSREDVQRVVEGYRARWTIEEYFKTVKTGCAYEARQLESFHSLSNLLAYTLVVAYAMLLMRALLRENRNLQADAVLTDSEIDVLRCAHRALSPTPTLREALLAIAALGGHLKNNGDPGWQVLSRGWQRLRDYEAGYRMARSPL